MVDVNPFTSDAEQTYRNNLINQLNACSTLLREIYRKRVQTPELEHFADEPAFKSDLIVLYKLCKPKFKYYPNDETIKLLDATTKVNHRLKLDQAIKLYEALVYFFEVSGITKFETQRHTTR